MVTDTKGNIICLLQDELLLSCSFVCTLDVTELSGKQVLIIIARFAFNSLDCIALNI